MTTFFTPGTPRPQGSKRAITNQHTGRTHLIESSKHVGDWRGDVKHAAVTAQGTNPPYTGPVAVHLAFHLPRPKSHPKTKITHPVKRPDIDKLTRAVLDALTGVIYHDDSQITYIQVWKLWDIDHPQQTPGVRIQIHQAPVEGAQP